MCSTIAGGKGGEATPGEPVLDTNLFAQNRDVMAVMAEKKPAPAGSLSDDPKFRDAAKVDFALQADSPARTAGVGAAEPLAPAGPWPLLAEEEAIIPAGETRDYQHWNSSDTPKTAQAKADTGVPRFDDAALREAALERIRAALKNGDLDKARVSTEVLARLLPAPSSAKTFREKLSKGAENVTDLFLEAYLNCQDAEKARQAGNPSAARAAYQAAITILDSITAKWPDWSPAIVKHRRTKAEEALKKLAAE